MNNLSREQIQKILSLLYKVGFKLHSIDPNTNEPLLIAPNGQVVTMTVGYLFLRDQVAKRIQKKNSVSISFEGVPNSSNNIESTANPDNSISFQDVETYINNLTKLPLAETAPNNIESPSVNRELTERSLESEKKETVELTKNSDSNKDTTSSRAQIPSANKTTYKPYGIGFDVDFNIEKIDQILKFIEIYKKRYKGSLQTSYSNTWIAVLFEKWLEEYQNISK
ncbi:MAG: hypothetical protein NZZ41_05240 [Candidatus Dojkabacteria bacterium]|nr:hypothetical protein [Candidatus Dojkabacteria bacterium]